MNYLQYILGKAIESDCLIDSLIDLTTYQAV